ncbi:MAG: hypothetical protein KJ957_02645, partial [Candidatus Omnitrophica bacterium]|nr:hypothetical protein [Candidatus Omnitrophota bacterium]
TPHVDKENILKDIAEAYVLDRDVFIAILRDKMDDEKIQGQDVEIFFEKYINEIKKLAVAVDKL